MSRQIEESINFGHCDPFWPISDLYDVGARTDFSFLQHAKVKSRSVMRYEQGWHASFIQADADAVARHARLGYFEHCITNPVSITDADFFIRKSCNGEIFSELSETEIIASQEALPVPVGIHLVDENG